MKNDQKLNQNDTIDEDNIDSCTHTVQMPGTVIIDNSSPTAMLDGLINTLGEIYGSQMFSNLTGIHAINGKLILSCASEYDIIH